MDVSLRFRKIWLAATQSCSQSSCQLVLAIKFQFLLMWAYGAASNKLVLTVSCYLLYGWCRHWASGVADGWKVCRTKGIHYSPFSVHGKCLLWTHMLRKKRGKKVRNCNSSSDVPCCFVPYLSATSRVLCVFLCDSSIRMCHTPQALDVSSRPPRLRDHVSPPAGEKAFSQRKRGTNQRLYVTCLLPMKESKA